MQLVVYWPQHGRPLPLSLLLPLALALPLPLPLPLPSPSPLPLPIRLSLPFLCMTQCPPVLSYTTRLQWCPLQTLFLLSVAHCPAATHTSLHPKLFCWYSRNVAVHLLGCMYRIKHMCHSCSLHMVLYLPQGTKPGNLLCEGACHGNALLILPLCRSAQWGIQKGMHRGDFSSSIRTSRLLLSKGHYLMAECCITCQPPSIFAFLACLLPICRWTVCMYPFLAPSAAVGLWTCGKQQGLL